MVFIILLSEDKEKTRMKWDFKRMILIVEWSLSGVLLYVERQWLPV